jgi:four helix bundle protein
MAYRSFESLDVWRRASRLAVRVYRVLKSSRDYGLRDQMTRAAVSIPSNIAEGYDRGTNREFIGFLRIAKGSAAELRTQLYIAKEIGEIDQNIMAELVEETKGIGAMLNKLEQARRSQTGETDNLPTPEALNLDTANNLEAPAPFPETGNRNPETEHLPEPGNRNP